MPSDKAAYLAAHYLSADPKPSSAKKRKRKHAAAPSAANGLLIQDDDEPGWSTSKPLDPDDDPDTTGNTPTISGTSAEFRRAKKSGWKTLSTPTNDTSAAEADAIIAAAATDHAAAARLADGDLDDPTTLTTTTQDATTVAPPTTTMSNGTLPGLQPASAITAQLRAVQAAERAELLALQASGAGLAEPDEVILRDATGRRVDATMRRAEARRAQAEAERAEEARKTALKGEVQLAEARRRREAVAEAALMTVARGRDDVAMNEEMRGKGRWNDPMAEFMSAGGKEGGGKRGKGKGGRRPVYNGAAPPNRYGIRPGYRWDGVDRGNGFEAERFKAINRRERNKDLSYHWQMDE